MHPNTSDESKDERSNPTRANDERGGDHHEQGEELGSHVLLPRKAASNTYGGSNDHLDDHGDETDGAACERDLAGRGALALNLHQHRVVRAEASNRRILPH